MSDYFGVDTDGLAKNAPYMRAYSDQVRQVITRLQSSLGSLGECWGDDPIGKSFANSYLGPRDEIISGFSGIVDVLNSTADGLETMAKGFAQVEDANVIRTRRIAGGSIPHGPRG